MNVVRIWRLPLSADGSRVALRGPDGRATLYPIGDGQPQPLTGLAADENPLAWTLDGRGMFVSSFRNMTQRVFRLDLATGRREAWKETSPSDTGLRLSQLVMSPDGRSYVHNYSLLLSDLYLVEGVR